jgi:2-oxoglutarate dehydrogenase E1 component
MSFSIDEKKHILSKLNEAVVFENFLHTKYLGQKRFSLEGGETTIPALDAMINKAAEMGVVEVMIGMAHRGRLNVLANVMQKTYGQIFNEFEGNLPDQVWGDGDVKYHMGFASQITTKNGEKVHLNSLQTRLTWKQSTRLWKATSVRVPTECTTVITTAFCRF